mgnify:FL=1
MPERTDVSPPTNPDQPPLMHNDCGDEDFVSTTDFLITRSTAECCYGGIWCLTSAATGVHKNTTPSGQVSRYCEVSLPAEDFTSSFDRELVVVSGLSDVEYDTCMAEHDAFTSRTAFPSSGTGLPDFLGTPEDGGCGLPCPDDSCR